jgi:subtilisin family serine protease
MTAAVQKLRGVGIATVIAAGNDGLTGYVGAPGCISSAVTVGSTTKTDTVSSFSNLSPAVDILAPGSSITSALPGGAYGIASGTSMATPHIAGAYAVMRSAKPTASLDQILAALQASPIMLGRDGVDRPRIELISAVAKLRAPPVKKHRGQAAGELLAQAGR